MRRRELDFLIALLGGALAGCGFAPLNLWPLALVGVAALAHVVFQSASRRRAFWMAWLWSVAHFTVGLNWIAHAFTYQDAMPHWFGYGAVVALSLYLALFPAAGMVLAKWGGGERPITFGFAFAACWALSEWLRGVAFTGFAWNPLGVVSLPMANLSQLAPLIGTTGLSLVLALTAASLWQVASGWRTTPIATLAVVLVASVLPLPAPSTVAEPGAPTLVVVQPNFSQDVKHGPDYGARAWDRQVALTRAARVPAGPRLVLWPEGAIEEPPLEDPTASLRVAALLRPGDALMAGGVTLARDRFGIVRSATNSVFAFDARGRVTGRYDKAHLVPYGEYLPMPTLLGALGLARLVPGDVFYAPGPGPRSLDVPGFGAIGVQLCYEIIFSGQVLDRAHRPRLLFNPSNDAWFGLWGPPQHLAQARMRAREEAMPIVRSTTNGVSAIVAADGAVLASIPRHQAGALVSALPPVGGATLFSRTGNALPLGVAFLVLLAAVALSRRRV